MMKRAPAVVLVEDDPLILLHSRLALEDAGFEALEATDARQALEHFAARHDIVALFTDVQLPGGIDGAELADRISASAPAVHIVVTSGKPTRGLPPTARFLPKPYQVFEVARIFRDDLATAMPQVSPAAAR